MNGKTGRLTFSGRQEYTLVKVYGMVGRTVSGEVLAGGVGYAAKCTCALGDHYLTRDAATGAITERTSDRGAVPDACIFPAAQVAAAAIEAWQRQQEQERER